MKKILLFFAAAVCAIASWAQTDATVSATVTGEELTVALTENGQQFVAFQMDIQLPAGVTVESTGAITLMTDRLTQPGTTSKIDASENVNFKVLYNVLPDNRLRVIAYNLENREIGGNEGDALFTVTLSAAPDEASDISLSNILFVTKNELAEIQIPEIDAISGRHPYDIDGVEGVTVSDALFLLTYIVEEKPFRADYDFDTNKGALTVGDAMVILNYVVENM